MTKKLTLALAAAALTLIPSVANAQNIDTVTPYSYSWQPFGEPDTSAYGQTFTVGTPSVLNGFSLFLDGSVANPVDFNAYIYAWNGTNIVGPALYSSGLQTFTGSANDNPTEFAFNTGSLALTPSSQYIAFLFADFAGDPSTAMMPSSTANYSGGSFVYSNVNGNFADLSNPWSNTGSSVWFRASFGDGSALPEPGTWAMMLLGFGGMGLAMRRQRRAGSALAAA